MFAVTIYGVIYGIGETESEAIIDAEQWADNMTDAKVMPCTERLASLVDSFGGSDIEYEVIDGMVMTLEEAAKK